MVEKNMEISGISKIVISRPGNPCEKEVAYFKN